MSTTLTLICCAGSEATRRAAFPLDEPIDTQGRRRAETLGRTLRRVDAAFTGPSLRARETAAALGLDAQVDAALDDLDAGCWAGRALEELPVASVQAWTTDPAAAPHGGESIDALLDRARRALGAFGRSEARVVAVSHAAILRAALLVALSAPATAFWRVDVAPLARLRLRGADGRWTLRSLES